MLTPAKVPNPLPAHVWLSTYCNIPAKAPAYLEPQNWAFVLPSIRQIQT